MTTITGSSAPSHTCAARAGWSVVVLATLVPLGCSSPSSVAANRQALQAPGPACNDGSVSTSVCSGPWEYQTYVAGCVGEMGPSWDCGSHMVPDPPNAVPNRCCDAALGLTPDHVDITSDPVDGQWVECGLCSPEFPCTWCHNGACDDICDVLPDVPPPGGLPGNVIAGFIDHNGNVIADCNSYAQTQVAQRTLTAKDGTQYTPVVTTAVLHHDSTHAWCVVGLDIEIFGCGENAGVCGTHSVDPGTQHLEKNTCRLPNPGGCGSDPTYKISSGGLSRKGLADQVGYEYYLKDGSPDMSNPQSLVKEGATCITGEPMPIDTPQQILDKARFLHQRFDNPSTVATVPNVEAVRDTIAANLRMLFELHAKDVTDPTERAFIESLYLRKVSTSCEGDGFVPPTVDSSCTVSTSLTTMLTVCQAFSGDPIPADSVKALESDCLGALQAVQQLTPGATCQDVYRAAYADVIGKLVAKLVGKSLTPNVANLQNALRLFHAWFVTEQTALGAQDAGLWSDVARVEVAFWSATHANGVKNLKLPAPADGGAGSDADAQQITQALHDADANDVAADFAILMALFPYQPPTPEGQMPMTSAPLLVVMHDALRSLADHVADVAAFHDFACHFANDDRLSGAADACALVNQDNDVSNLTALLGSFPSASDLSAEVTRAQSFFNGQSPDWSVPFAALSHFHSAFESAVLAALDPNVLAQIRPNKDYAPILVLNTTLAAATPALTDLGRLANDFTSRKLSYRTVGLFDPALRDTLPFGIQTGSQYQQFVKSIGDQTGNLVKSISDYKQNLRTVTTDLLSYLQTVGKQYDTSALLAAKARQYMDLQSQIAAMQKAQSDDDAAFGQQATSFAADFGDLTSSGAVDGNTLMRVSGKHYLNNFNEGQAKFTGGPGDQSFKIADIAVDAFPGQPNPSTQWKMTVARGSVITIESGGKWSPTCALKQAFGGDHPLIKTNPGEVNVASFDGALATSEGYYLNKTDSGYSLTSHTHTETSTDTIDVGVTAKACAGYGTDAIWKTSFEICAHISFDHNWSTSDQDASSKGSETRASASFTSGLHVPNTPFPFMAAGSLLLVTVRKDRQYWHDILDVQPVLSGQNAYVVTGDPDDASAPVDVYLVVNDRNCGNNGNDTLHVDTSLWEPLDGSDSSHLTKLSTAMAQALHDIDQARASYVAQGRFLPEQRTAARSKAMAYLAKQGISLSDYPQPFTTLYTAWIDKQIARIERAVEIEMATQQSDLLLIEMMALQKDAQLAGVQTRIQQLLPAWSLDNLEADQVRFQADLVTHLFNQLFPVLRIRYPELLNSIRSTTTTQDRIKKLLNAKWNDSFLSLANEMSVASQEMVNLVTSSVPARNPLSPVVLQFPKSDRIKQLYPRCGGPPGDGGAGANPSPTPPPSVYHYKQASVDRADALWAAICGSGLGTFEIRPEDVYDSGAALDQGAASLDCRDSAPVMRSMAIVLTGNNLDNVNKFPFEAEAGLGSRLPFATPDGVLTYNLQDRSWLPSKFPILAAPLGGEVSAFHGNQNDVGAGDGLSPFNVYQINMRQVEGAADSPLVGATAITVVFSAESANTMDSVRGVSSCEMVVATQTVIANDGSRRTATVEGGSSSSGNESLTADPSGNSFTYHHSGAAQTVSLNLSWASGAPSSSARMSASTSASGGSSGDFSAAVTVSDGDTVTATPLDWGHLGVDNVPVVITHADGSKVALVAVDASRLSGQQLQISGQGDWFDSRMIHDLQLAPGTYDLVGNGGSAGIGSFTITPDGTIDYDLGRDKTVFTGRGSTTLHIVAHLVIINAKLLTPQQLAFYDGGGGSPYFPSDTPQNFQLAAADHYLLETAGGGGLGEFSVRPDGKISYDSALDTTVFTGKDTTTLGIVPHEVTIDGSALTPQQLAFYYGGTGSNPYFQTQTPQKFQLAAADGYLLETVGGGGIGNFTVKPDGSITYDAALDQHVFTGSGKKVLTIVGHSITVDATAVSSQQAIFYYGGGDAQLDSSLRKTVVIPAADSYLVEWVAGEDLTGGYFAVKPDGNVDYDASLNAIFSGSNSTTLKILAPH